MYTTRIRAMWQWLNNNPNFTRSAMIMIQQWQMFTTVTNVYNSDKCLPPKQRVYRYYKYTTKQGHFTNVAIDPLFLKVCVCPTVSAGDLKSNSKRLSRCEKEREQWNANRVLVIRHLLVLKRLFVTHTERYRNIWFGKTDVPYAPPLILIALHISRKRLETWHYQVSDMTLPG